MHRLKNHVFQDLSGEEPMRMDLLALNRQQVGIIVAAAERWGKGLDVNGFISELNATEKVEANTARLIRLAIVTGDARKLEHEERYRVHGLYQRLGPDTKRMDGDILLEDGDYDIVAKMIADSPPMKELLTVPFVEEFKKCPRESIQAP